MDNQIKSTTDTKLDTITQPVKQNGNPNQNSRKKPDKHFIFLAFSVCLLIASGILTYFVPKKKSFDFKDGLFFVIFLAIDAILLIVSVDALIIFLMNLKKKKDLKTPVNIKKNVTLSPHDALNNKSQNVNIKNGNAQKSTIEKKDNLDDELAKIIPTSSQENSTIPPATKENGQSHNTDLPKTPDPWQSNIPTQKKENGVGQETYDNDSEEEPFGSPFLIKLDENKTNSEQNSDNLQKSPDPWESNIPTPKKENEDSLENFFNNDDKTYVSEEDEEEDEKGNLQLTDLPAKKNKRKKRTRKTIKDKSLESNLDSDNNKDSDFVEDIASKIRRKRNIIRDKTDSLRKELDELDDLKLDIDSVSRRTKRILTELKDNEDDTN